MAELHVFQSVADYLAEWGAGTIKFKIEVNTEKTKLITNTINVIQTTVKGQKLKTVISFK